MAANDRRTSYMNAPRPRVVSSRVDADKPNRGAASPLPADMDPLRTSTSSQKHRMSRDQKNMSEKRTERTTITTKEKTMRRNPVKESSTSAVNRGDGERSRSKRPSRVDDASPGPLRGEADATDGQSPSSPRVESVH